MAVRQKLERFDAILVCIALLSVFLNVFNIWNDQYANSYYTSAVTSMLQSFHNFFYASFDPGGFVTVDKPPVAFWVQTVFAYFFGVHGWSVILPQALANVGSVLLIYCLVKPTFGRTAARLASLVLACTPIAVAVSRTNNIDGLLVFTLLLATWMLFKGIRNRSGYWVLGAFAMIGVGFNEKMLQAYMVVPAFYLFYLLAFKVEWKKKLAVLAAATAVLVGVSLSWAVVVDNIPEENRPYIGGSQTNSVLELAFGYNGVFRLIGGMGDGARGGSPPAEQPARGDVYGSPGGPAPYDNAAPGPMPGPGGDRPSGRTAPDGSGPEPTRQPGSGGPPGGGMGGGGAFGTGQAGPLRLFQKELSGQVGWLLPLAAFASVALLAGIRRRKPLTDRQEMALFWLAWLLPGMVFFSVAGFYHQYYLIMLAPPIAALVGAGWVELWNRYRESEGWKARLLPSALLATTAFELYVLRPYQGQIGVGWLVGIGSAGLVLSLALLLAKKREKLASIAAAAGMLVLLAAPLYWAATPLLYGDNSMLPQAGPGQGRLTIQKTLQLLQPITNGGTTSDTDDRLLEYVTRNNTGEKYLFATAESHTAAPYIIRTGKAVMAMGGFSGSDPILTVEKIEELVENHEVKFFLISSGSGPGGGRGGSEVMDWIRARSTEVPREEWGSNSRGGSRSMGMGGETTLYCIDW